jgi:hypothetical protein
VEVFRPATERPSRVERSLLAYTRVVVASYEDLPVAANRE